MRRQAENAVTKLHLTLPVQRYFNYVFSNWWRSSEGKVHCGECCSGVDVNRHEHVMKLRCEQVVWVVQVCLNHIVSVRPNSDRTSFSLSGRPPRRVQCLSACCNTHHIYAHKTNRVVSYFVCLSNFHSRRPVKTYQWMSCASITTKYSFPIYKSHSTFAVIICPVCLVPRVRWTGREKKILNQKRRE